MRSLIKNEEGSSFAFFFAILLFFFFMLMWTGLFDPIQEMMDIGVADNAALPAALQNPNMEYMVLIVELVPVFIMIGLTLYAFTEAQKRSDGD